MTIKLKSNCYVGPVNIFPNFLHCTCCTLIIPLVLSVESLLEPKPYPTQHQFSDGLIYMQQPGTRILQADTFTPVEVIRAEVKHYISIIYRSGNDINVTGLSIIWQIECSCEKKAGPHLNL